MAVLVEPVNGPELDRLVTALLNATGTVHYLIAQEGGSPGTPSPEGLKIIDRCAARLRSALAVFAELHTDAELAEITEFLAVVSLGVAADGGFGDVFCAD
jgi:hypothetical protein